MFRISTTSLHSPSRFCIRLLTCLGKFCGAWQSNFVTSLRFFFILFFFVFSCMNTKTFKCDIEVIASLFYLNAVNSLIFTSKHFTCARMACTLCYDFRYTEPWNFRISNVYTYKYKTRRPDGKQEWSKERIEMTFLLASHQSTYEPKSICLHTDHTRVKKIET